MPTEAFNRLSSRRVRRRFEARGDGVATTEAEVHAADGDPNAFSLQRAIAFTRAMAVGADGGGGGKAAPRPQQPRRRRSSGGGGRQAEDRDAPSPQAQALPYLRK